MVTRSVRSEPHRVDSPRTRAIHTCDYRWGPLSVPAAEQHVCALAPHAENRHTCLCLAGSTVNDACVIGSAPRADRGRSSSAA
jgi:hypothetical protein